MNHLLDFYSDCVDPEEITVCATWTATIWVGRRVGYTNELVDLNEIERVVQNYCNKRPHLDGSTGWCVTVTPTMFYYMGGNEPGVAIGIIDYPRFPERSVDTLQYHSLKLAKILKDVCRQKRVTVVMPHDTVMIGDPE